MSLRFLDFTDLTPSQRDAAAQVMADAFAHMPGAFDGAFAEEVDSFLTDPDRAAVAAVRGERVLGWVGRIAGNYDYAWEMHPLCVDPPAQRSGVGAALVGEIEARARAAGMLTLYLGTDDDFGGTTLAGQELFPGVAQRIATLAEIRGHPFAFYRKQGYEVVGLLPHVNGFGKPDILMAKRL
jgi:aminoglycoside 6'-N-acetyltransferase I